MTNHLNQRHLVWLFIGVSAIVYMASLLLFSVPKNSNFAYYLKSIPTAITISLLFLIIFIKYIWKWKVFHKWLIPFPNLNGTWKGYIHSTWIDPDTNTRPTPIPVILTIRQSLFKISCVMRTEEMESFSFASGFVMYQENQLLKLVYSYESIPKQTVKGRSPQHFGTIVFNISSQNKKELIGEYWTERKTTGSIELEFWKKELYDKYPEELGKHPVSLAQEAEKTNYKTDTSVKKSTNPKEVNVIIKGIRELISNSKLGEAIDELQNIIPDKLRDDLLMIKNQYSRLVRKDTLNIESQEKMDILENKITKSLLQIIQQLEINK